MKRLKTIVIVGLIVSVMVTFGGSTVMAKPQSQTVGGTLVYALDQEPDTLDSHKANLGVSYVLQGTWAAP